VAMETLFTQALGLVEPWRVVNVDFQPAVGQIVFKVENTANRLACPACGAADQPIHDRLPRRWQHLNFFQFKAIIEAPVPRVGCRACEKTSQVAVPWARPGSGFTLTLEAFVVALCSQMPVAAVANCWAYPTTAYGGCWTSTWRQRVPARTMPVCVGSVPTNAAPVGGSAS